LRFLQPELRVPGISDRITCRDCLEHRASKVDQGSDVFRHTDMPPQRDPTVAESLDDTLRRLGNSWPVQTWEKTDRTLLNDPRVKSTHDSITSQMIKLKSLDIETAEGYRSWVHESARIRVSSEVTPGPFRLLSTQDVHDSLIKEHSGLPAHPLIAPLRLLIDTSFVMTDVCQWAPRHRKPLTDRSHQTKCNNCKKNAERECVPAGMDSLRPKSSRAKCLTCRERKVTCNWGTMIPKFLYPVKLSIYENLRAQQGFEADQSEMGRSEAAVDVWNGQFLQRFMSATVSTVTEVNFQLRAEREAEVEGLLSRFDSIRCSDT